MQNRNESRRDQFRISATGLTRCLICSLVEWILFLPTLHGQSTGQNAEGASIYSSATAPVAPSNLIATEVSDTRIRLSWTYDSTTTVAGFLIERKTGTGAYAKILSLSGAMTVDANARSYLNTGLSANTPYSYRISAYYNREYSLHSNETNARTLMIGPSSLAATVVSSSQIDLMWRDSTTNETGFEIERSLAPSGLFMWIGKVNRDTTRFSNTGLVANTQYSYRVRAVNSRNATYSVWSKEVNAMTRLAAPNNLMASSVSANQIALEWSYVSTNVSGFKIERKTETAPDVYTNYVQIATVEANTRSFPDTTRLYPNTKFVYKARAYKNDENSDYSNAASARTFMVGPSNLVATAASNQINLEWKDTKTNATSFEIARSIAAADSFSQVGTANSSARSFSDRGANLTLCTQYFYRVRKINAKTGNVSDWSSVANAMLLSSMAQPDSLKARTVSNRINLEWRDNSNNEDGFEVWRKTGMTGIYAAIKPLLGPNTTGYTDIIPAPGETTYLYFYRVRAVKFADSSCYSNEVSAELDIPAAPSNMKATPASDSRIDLAWKDNATNEDGFKIERKNGAAGQYAQIAKVNKNVTSFADMNITRNTTYSYRVRAYNNAGHSAYSIEANVIRPSPSAPSNLTAIAVSSSQINLAWTDKSSNEVGFLIERKTGAAGAYGQIAMRLANVTSHIDISLTSNITYFYRVRAYNAAGHSAYSNEASATTPPPIIGKPAAGEAESVIPDEISLAPNYPNPFNPATTISFALPAGAHVSLKVINITGQQVAILVDGYRERGFHRATLNAATLPGGVYFAVLKAGEASLVQRMILKK